MASAKSAPGVNGPGGGGGVGVGGGVTLASHTWVPRLDLITEKQNNAVQIDLLAAYLVQTTSINCWTVSCLCWCPKWESRRGSSLWLARRLCLRSKVRQRCSCLLGCWRWFLCHITQAGRQAFQITRPSLNRGLTTQPTSLPCQGLKEASWHQIGHILSKFHTSPRKRMTSVT